MIVRAASILIGHSSHPLNVGVEVATHGYMVSGWGIGGKSAYVLLTIWFTANVIVIIVLSLSLRRKI
jgi:hypothetical protein